MKVDYTSYCEELEKALSEISFDPSSGESFGFEELFYPLRVDEGKYAFQSYNDQMRQAHALSESTPDAAKTQRIINKLSSAKRADDSPMDTEKQYTVYRRNIQFAKAKQNIESAQMKIGSVEIKEKQHLSVKSEEQNAGPGLLLEESLYPHSSLMIPRGFGDYSRILAVASAGHGKTTLIKRIALYFCRPLSHTREHIELAASYGLVNEDGFIPCIIKLRDIGANCSVDSAVKESIAEVFGVASNAKELCEWIDEERGRLFLLIDGLDELSDSVRAEFLSKLEDYLVNNPDTPVLMTSRVAGLSTNGVTEKLEAMNFRGRSIIPLTDEDAKKYSERWIDVTQPEDKRVSLKRAIEQILTQNRFSYLKEFMRTPLELIVILKQVADNTLSLNRYMMFRDMLWELFTNHEKYNRKSAVYEDIMTLLSFIAYQMQLKDSLYISEKEIGELEEDLSYLSFQTNRIEEHTAKGFIRFLDTLASNVGIVEKNDREGTFTFPIRAYQEFLTAYACCHLNLDEEIYRPDPVAVISEHIQDSRWSSIINFALSDLEANNQSREFDELLKTIFTEAEDYDFVKSVIESNLVLTKDNVEALCKKRFCSSALNEKDGELLRICMETKTAASYLYAIRTLYQTNQESESYIEANAVAAIIWEYNAGNSPWSAAIAQLKKSVKLGAKMISILAKAYMGEALKELEGIGEAVKRDAIVTRDMASILYEEKSAVCVEALTDLWVSRLENFDIIKQYLDKALAKIVVDAIDSCSKDIDEFWLLGKEWKKSGKYKELKNLIYALGTIPECTDFDCHGRGNRAFEVMLEHLYEQSITELNLDQTAIARVSRCYIWTQEQFVEAWVEDICGGTASFNVQKNTNSIRCRNHFDYAKVYMYNPEREYLGKTSKKVSTEKTHEEPTTPEAMQKALKSLEAEVVGKGSAEDKAAESEDVRKKLGAITSRIAEMKSKDTSVEDYRSRIKRVTEQLGALKTE